MRKQLNRFSMYLAYLGVFSLVGCGPEVAAIPIVAAAAAGGAIAATSGSDTAQNDNGGTGGGSPSDDLSNLDGIYHISAMSAETSLVTCPSSLTGWFEADGQTLQITRGFFLFMNCNTQTLDRIEIDGDFFFEDIDNDVCSQAGCVRFDLDVSGTGAQGQRVWRGFLVRGGEGIVFAQVDPFNGSVLAGSGWRTSGGPTTANDPVMDMMGNPVGSAAEVFRAPG